MEHPTYYSKRASLSFSISEFEVPPMQDLLVIGKKAPIGPEAVKRMAEVLSPEQFSIIRLDHPRVEAVLLKKNLLEMIDQKVLTGIILEEISQFVNDSMVLRGKINISISIQREVELL